MKLSFLCAPHRVELTNKPNKAIRCWQDGFDTGQALYDQHMFKEALPYLGCAFETSEIILSSRIIDSKSACEFFSSSAVACANTLAQLECIDRAFEVFWMAINRLEKECYQHQKDKPWITSYLVYFYECIQSADFNSKQSDLGSIFKVDERFSVMH